MSSSVTGFLLPWFRRMSRGSKRMARDAGVQFVINIFRSRLCLLSMVLTMTVLLLLHYHGATTDIQTLNVNRFQKRTLVGVRDSINNSTKSSPSSVPQKQKCKKQFNVSFLKVHKAGSTTVMNIFLRFAIQYGLNIVLPNKASGFGFNYLGYGKTVSRDRIVPLPTNQTYNILCNHVVYNKDAFRSIMPNNTKYVGILREPESNFRSASTYFGFYQALQKYSMEKKLQINGSVLSEFLKDQGKFKVGHTYYVHNKMSFDLGLPSEKFGDDVFIESYFKELNNDYELMLMMEEFEESLVLMKRLLCWDMKDILYVPLNKRAHKAYVPLSEEDRQNLRIWNKADFKLYDLFKTVFNAKKISQGADFEEEVNVFKATRKEVEDYCHKLVQSPKETPPIDFVKATKFNEEFQVTKSDCILMMEPELHMMQRLIQGAWRTYNASLHL